MNQEDEFLELVTHCQGYLYSYILSVLADHDAANEVLQECNLVIWRKHEEFQLGTNFRAWVMRIANLQVMAYRQKRYKDMRLFNLDLIDQISKRTQQRESSYDEKINMLANCLDKLSDHSREIITRRYTEGESISNIARDLDKKCNAVRQLIFRIKNKLVRCVNFQKRAIDNHA